MANPQNNDDCYFYYYSSCTKGDECPFRHCKSALGTEIVCSLWREGRCFRNNCKFRHMESRIKRSEIPCYWENQPGGCRKPHCVFLHQKDRSLMQNTTENQGLILPVSTSRPSSPPNKTSENKDNLKIPLNYPPLDSPNEGGSITLSPSHTIEPVVVSFDEGEESDNESISSTPVKNSFCETKVSDSDAKCDLNEKFSIKSEEKDFGVKTLEELKMAKIHKESEHFYKPDESEVKGIADKPIDSRISSSFADSVFNYSVCSEIPVDHVQKKFKLENDYAKDIFYPPGSANIIPLSNNSSPDKNALSHNIEATVDSTTLENDLREKILKRRAVQQSKSDKELPSKKIISLKRSHNTTEDSLDFKIKTLDEIKREKENKIENNIFETINSESKSQDNEKISITNKNVSLRKIRIHKDQSSNVTKTTSGASKESSEDRFNSIEILKKFENDSNNYNENSLSKDNSLQNLTSKRKEEFISEKPSKMLKIENSIQRQDADTFDNNRTDISHQNKSEENNSVKPIKRLLIKRNNYLLQEKISLQQKQVISQCFRETNISTPITQSSKSDIELPKVEFPILSDNPKSEINNQSFKECDDQISTNKTVTNQKEEENDKPRTTTLPSVDDFDHLFLVDTDINLDEVDDNTDGKADDILLKIDQMLES